MPFTSSTNGKQQVDITTRDCRLGNLRNTLLAKLIDARLLSDARPGPARWRHRPRLSDGCPPASAVVSGQAEAE